MIRVKSFDATGIAPGGRLFAGDLNAIQDAAAALADLTQNHQVATLAVGESGLQLVRFGAGEARMTGAMRVDGILRGLSGLYAGQYTTTQRDAIAAGSRPTGLVVFNTTANRLEVNGGTDATPAWTALGGSVTQGTLASRPGATSANALSYYFATDDNGGTLYANISGSAWTKIAPGITETKTPTDGTVTTAKIAAGGIAPSAITGTAVITSDARLSDTRTPTDGSVTSAKIATDAVTATQIAANAVGSSELADGSVDAAAIIDGVVGSAKVTDGSLLWGDMAHKFLRPMDEGTMYRVMWGSNTPTTDANGTFTIGFPAGFGTACAVVVATNGDYGAANFWIDVVGSNTAGFVGIANQGGGNHVANSAVRINWIAIGY